MTTPKVEAPLGYLELRTQGAPADAKLPMIVGIHGLGDSPEGFARLLADLPFPARIILPRAPTPYGQGYSWLPVRVRDEAPAKMIAAIDADVPALVTLIQRLEERFPTQGRPVITGFSQGGILSYALALRRPELWAGVVPISGLLPEAIRPDHWKGPPLVALHGQADEVVPYRDGAATLGRFKNQGGRVELLSYPGVGHEVTPEMRAELFRRLHTLTASVAN